MRRFRKRMLVSGVTLSLILSSLPTTYISAIEKNNMKFSDIKYHWAENFINDFTNKGYIRGYGDGTFRPNNKVTRAEFIRIVNMTFGFTQKGSENFSDVNKGDWYYDEVLKAIKQGYINGYEDGTFRPNDKITREEACKIIGTMLKASGDGITKFKDEKEIADWAIKCVDGLVDKGIIHGYEDNTFKPQNNITRAESIKTLHEAKEKYNPEDGEPPVINPTPPTINPMPPVKPDDVKLDLKYNRINNSVALSWSGIDKVKYTLKKGESKEKLNIIEDALSQNIYIDELDSNNKEYYYYVEGKDERGKIYKSEIIKVKKFIDVDGDFLEDSEEVKLGTDSKNPDTDGDGLLDGEEVNLYKTNPKKIDTDVDGLSDSFEILMSRTNPNKKDTDNNGITDDNEDLDNDSLNNKKEMELGTDPLSDDTDYDNLKDSKELELGTDPKNPDIDGDGILDGDEVNTNLDPLKKDTDDDGILDHDENIKYEIENSDIDKDEDVQVKLNITTDAKNIKDIYINNIERTDFIINEETPGYLGAPYYLNIPKGDETIIEFSYKGDKKYSGKLGIYFYNEDIQYLEEVTNKVSTKSNNTISAKVNKPGKYILLDKEEQEKAWEKVIVPPTSGKKKLDIVLAIDSSESMSYNDPNELRKSESRIFVDRLIKSGAGRAAIVKFIQGAAVLSSLTDDLDRLNWAIDKINAMGGTNLSIALDTSTNELKRNSNDNAEKYTLLLTDGKQDKWSPPFDYNSIENAKINNNKVYTIGLGYDIDSNLLNKIAIETGGRYLHANVAEDLDELFEEFTGETIDRTTDTDGDGISDYHEDYFRIGNGRVIKLNKNSSDTDGDGISDGEEAGLKKVGDKFENDTPYGFSKEKGYWKVKSNPNEVDTDGDGISDNEDIYDEEGNIVNPVRPENNPAIKPNITNNTSFSIEDNIFMHASDFAYLPTDGKGSDISKMEFTDEDKKDRGNYERIKDWKVIESDDSYTWDSDVGFGAVAIKKDKNIIISFEGSGKFVSQELIFDWIITDIGSIMYGMPSVQVYEAYKFLNKVMNSSDFKGANVYITGHSLGGWLAQKTSGSILQGEKNLVSGNSPYYTKSQIPPIVKSEVENMYKKTFKAKKDKIKKIVTFASPGFLRETSIYEDEAQSRLICYNYRVENDPVWFFTSKYELLFGRNKFVKGKKYVLNNHGLKYYYNHFEEFFKGDSSYEIPNINMKDKHIS